MSERTNKRKQSQLSFINIYIENLPNHAQIFQTIFSWAVEKLVGAEIIQTRKRAPLAVDRIDARPRVAVAAVVLALIAILLASYIRVPSRLIVAMSSRLVSIALVVFRFMRSSASRCRPCLSTVV
jgi:hypothetical protein